MADSRCLDCKKTKSRHPDATEQKDASPPAQKSNLFFFPFLINGVMLKIGWQLSQLATGRVKQPLSSSPSPQHR